MRTCVNPNCCTKLNGCFGYILARDMVAVHDGKLSFPNVRELCGRCVLKFENQLSKLERIIQEMGDAK